MRGQMLWHLPGIEHMTFGFNIVKGEEALAQLFYFGYCNDRVMQTVQDTYRGNVYTVPEEIYAQPAPKCSFSMDTKFYNSAVNVAQEMLSESGK
jgi:hypothetical protein